MVDNKDFHVAPWIFLIKKDVLNRTNLRFEEGIIYEDMIFAYKLFCESLKTVYLPEYLYYRRYRENSVMTSKVTLKNWKSAFEVYCKVHAYWEQLPDNMKSEKHVIRCAYNGLNIYEKLSFSDKKVCSMERKQLVEKILNNNAYNEQALKVRCYGKCYWVLYKGLMKIRQAFKKENR